MQKKAQPFVKWFGGKRSLVATLRAFLPPKLTGYIEPFVGGGAFFFNLSPNRFIIADSNPDLINCYEVIRNQRPRLIKELRTYPDTKEAFIAIRDRNPSSLTSVQRAAQFIYLNKTCHRGQYRITQSGRFSAAYGYHRQSVFDPDNLKLVEHALRGGEIVCGDYADVLLARAKKGDFIFADPPYLPRGDHFAIYSTQRFGQYEHTKLAAVMTEMDRRGCLWMMTNAHSPLVKKLYAKFNVEEVVAGRAFKEGKGRVAMEYVIRNYG